jgi:hypothetical protein
MGGFRACASDRLSPKTALIELISNSGAKLAPAKDRGARLTRVMPHAEFIGDISLEFSPLISASANCEYSR